MDRGTFEALLPVITAHLADRISTVENISEDKAIEMLYATGLYASLENEDTKVWQYSTEMLYELYQSEKATGKLELPEYDNG